MRLYREKYNQSYLYVNNRKHGTMDVYRKESSKGLHGGLFYCDGKPLKEGIILRNGLGHTLPYRRWEWEGDEEITSCPFNIRLLRVKHI